MYAVRNDAVFQWPWINTKYPDVSVITVTQLTVAQAM